MDNIVVKNWNSNLEWTLVIENLSRKMVVVFFKKWDQFHSHVKDKVHCTIVFNLNSKRMDKFLLQTGFEKISTALKPCVRKNDSYLSPTSLTTLGRLMVGLNFIIKNLTLTNPNSDILQHEKRYVYYRIQIMGRKLIV